MLCECLPNAYSSMLCWLRLLTLPSWIGPEKWAVSPVRKAKRYDSKLKPVMWIIISLPLRVMSIQKKETQPAKYPKRYKTKAHINRPFCYFLLTVHRLLSHCAIFLESFFRYRACFQALMLHIYIYAVKDKSCGGLYVAFSSCDRYYWSTLIFDSWIIQAFDRCSSTR